MVVDFRFGCHFQNWGERFHPRSDLLVRHCVYYHRRLSKDIDGLTHIEQTRLERASHCNLFNLVSEIKDTENHFYRNILHYCTYSIEFLEQNSHSIFLFFFSVSSSKKFPGKSQNLLSRNWWLQRRDDQKMSSKAIICRLRGLVYEAVCSGYSF